MIKCECYLCALKRASQKFVAEGLAATETEADRLIRAVIPIPVDDNIADDAPPTLNLLAGPNACAIPQDQSG